MKKLFLILLISAQTFAGTISVDSDHDELVHHTAHFGISYVIQDVSQRFFEKAFGMPRTSAFWFGFLISNCIGISYKFLEGSGPVQGLGPALLYNNLGNLSAGLTFVIWKF